MTNAKQILADIDYLHNTGVWPSPIPTWVVEVAKETRASHYREAVVITTGYARAAKAAVAEADTLRAAHLHDSSDHMGTIALASRLSAALEWEIGIDRTRDIVEGRDAVPVYGGAIMGTDARMSKIETAHNVVGEHAMAAIHKIMAELEHFGVSPAELRLALDMWTSIYGGIGGRHFEDVLIARYEAATAGKNVVAQP